MKRVIRWTFVMATAFAMVACADVPGAPSASKIEPIAPQRDLVNMPAGQVPFIDYQALIDIVDENGHTIWQDMKQPTNGASITLESPPFVGSPLTHCDWSSNTEACIPLGRLLFIADPQDDCTGDADGLYRPRIGHTLAMYHHSYTCYGLLRPGNSYEYFTGDNWRVTAAPTAPGGRYFRRTEISMIGLNGDPARQVLPCAEGAASLTCTVTMPQDIDGDNDPLFRVYYGLLYPFGGFLSPVDAPPTVNLAKAGAAVPLKFSLGSDLGLDILAAGSPSSIQVPCAASFTLDALEETSASSNSGLKYDAASNQYTYVWKTEKSWAGMCRELRLAFTDNAPAKTAIFQFTK